MSHKCPKKGCETDVADDKLTCKEHWFLIPRPLRTAVWRAWDNERGAGTPEHIAAIAAAVRALNAE